MALNGIPISEDQCIGDSLDTLNNSFTTLDTRISILSSNIDQINVKIDEKTYYKQKFTANGLTSTFSISSLVGNSNNSFLYRVDINGVVQEPGTNSFDGDYYITSGNLVFNNSPLNGTKIVVVGPVKS